ncbi:hypothetical protein [Amphritea balenae]|uniref:Uncharacterized protein n=1 Tax=Amphritea balenae TaxID=452629 RepID=A0A3P1SMU4_9GAMM|nr:hypothetical protein [Amphritea balenae]RRC98254.1 hypothetical protein EHS89_14275 [Amphritea balenae]GGK80421.1 hypothetical protein GCM10007941_33460 [Amphritea balenae]
MKAKILTTAFSLLLLNSPLALADCSDEQTWCETKCEVKHLGDDAAVTGCKSKCVAARAACSTKVGAETAWEATKDAADNTKSFFKGLTE